VQRGAAQEGGGRQEQRGNSGESSEKASVTEKWWRDGEQEDRLLKGCLLDNICGEVMACANIFE